MRYTGVGETPRVRTRTRTQASVKHGGLRLRPLA